MVEADIQPGTEAETRLRDTKGGSDDRWRLPSVRLVALPQVRFEPIPFQAMALAARMSLPGGASKRRPYSRVNWVTLA